MQVHHPSPTKHPRRDAARARVERSFRNVLRRFVVLAAGLLLVVPALASAQQRRVVQMRPIEPARPAPAADEDPFDRPGLYVGVGGSYQFNPFHSRLENLIENALDKQIGAGANTKVQLGDSGGLNGTVGYRAASFFAVEIEYEWIDKYEVKGSVDSPIAVSGDLYGIQGHTITLNTKWIIPFWRIQPYLVLGGGVGISDVSRGSLFDTYGTELKAAGINVQSGANTKPAARAGLGVDLYVTKHIVVNAMASTVLTTLQKPDLGNIDDLDYISFSGGLQYRF